jgi:hypothetical protein
VSGGVVLRVDALAFGVVGGGAAGDGLRDGLVLELLLVLMHGAQVGGAADRVAVLVVLVGVRFLVAHVLAAERQLLVLAPVLGGRARESLQRPLLALPRLCQTIPRAMCLLSIVRVHFVQVL